MGFTLTASSAKSGPKWRLLSGRRKHQVLRVRLCAIRERTGRHLRDKKKGQALVDQHHCYDGWNAGVCGSCPHGPNTSWQKPCTKQLIITKILGY